MHPLLQQTAERLELHFRADGRCLGIYLWGSAGRGTEDQYSDLDLGVVVRDGEFEAVRGDLRSTCERVCGKIQGWLPEGERDQFGNYAFLFEAGGELLLCDLTVMSAGFLTRNPWSRPIRILFDPEGRLAAGQSQGSPPPYSPDGLLTSIHDYWVYAYLNGKYWKRSDLDKLLYVQSRLFQIHVKLLHALHPDEEWSWWPVSLHHLPEEHHAAMRVYFGASELTEIAAALRRELDLFSRDARAAAAAWDVAYPDALEQAVRRHLREMGLPIA
jgi:predicted nucleotidyltransferase